MIWLVLLILIVTAIVLIRLGRRVSDPETPTDVTLRAALKLHAIQSRLIAARTQRETRRDADLIRQRLMAELNAMAPSDYDEPER